MSNYWHIPFMRIVEEFVPSSVNQKDIHSVHADLLSRACGNHKEAALIFIGEAYGLTMSEFVKSRCDNYMEFFRLKLGNARYQKARDWDLF